MDYYSKYLKYKQKYLKGKLLLSGGGDSTKPTLYLFKAEWCGHCKSFKSDWEQLNKDPELSKKINMVTFDSDKNQTEIKKFNVSGYPTIMLETNDKLVEYEGNRNVNNIKEFINSYYLGTII